jgi:hypothetical protein
MGVEVQLDASAANKMFKSLIQMTLIDPPEVAASRRRQLYSNHLTQLQVQYLDDLASARRLSSTTLPAASQSDAISKYSSMILESKVGGEENTDIVMSSLRFSSGVLSPSNSGGRVYVNMSTPLTATEALDEDIVPYHIQLTVSSTQKSDVKVSFGILSQVGYGDSGANFTSNPATLQITDLSVCGSVGCTALITMPNLESTLYYGNNVDVRQQKKYITFCNGTSSVHNYYCPLSPFGSRNLDISVNCNRTFIGNITSRCPYVRSRPSCQMILPSSLSSGLIRTTGSSCKLQNFTSTLVTCKCSLSSKVSRRRLSSVGNEFQFTTETDTQTIQIQSQYSVQPSPTHAPTSKPTYAPTTPEPTYEPGDPTPKPTLEPTYEPTRKPTHRPTVFFEAVTIEVLQTVNGLDASDFDTPDKLRSNGRIIVLAVVNTINNANGWSIQEEDVELISVSSARRRRLLSSNVNIKYKVTGGAVGMP